MHDSTEFGREDRCCCFRTAVLDRSLRIRIAAPGSFVVVNAELDVFVSVSGAAYSWSDSSSHDMMLEETTHQ
jgi:hypothetical protein